MAKRAVAVLLMATGLVGGALHVCAQGVGVATAQVRPAGSFDKLRTGSSTAVGASAPTSAQDDKGNGGTATAVADEDAPGHGFEVATVKPANENDQRMWWGY